MSKMQVNASAEGGLTTLLLELVPHAPIDLRGQGAVYVQTEPRQSIVGFVASLDPQAIEKEVLERQQWGSEGGIVLETVKCVMEAAVHEAQSD